ncbi:parvulin-like peptidyl-prolyl isomerase [Longilinea arvoryzae]|uniref:Parvulin-like peptidyl-prolyl isomerase n=1 Tax=Longilinea arvoryzae TaxID=360412 RepID=A0A0S7B9I6_9CHLR|nr:peptidylprolyl isomerase [Longilinea arvoryzae]GAP14039.1 parvulin-like peptidyl-prolyl isomerase [Longilinea arvoryzae]
MSNRKISYLILLFLFTLTACNGLGASPATQTPAVPNTDTPAPATPSPTSEPLAARVNGEGILLADYQAELGRFQAALAETGKTATDEEARQRVLDSLVDEMLLAQAATAGGYQSSDADIQSSLDQMTQKIGGAEALTEWQQKNGYTEESFRRAVSRSLASAWQRDQILAAVPTSAEQIHARQILVLSKETADSIHNNLQSGADFATLAEQYDPVTGGDLGWFPRGYLMQPAVEEAAFALQPEQYSPVVQSNIGYHIIQVIEREEHPLAPDALQTLQRKALADWLTQRRAESQIETLLP